MLNYNIKLLEDVTEVKSFISEFGILEGNRPDLSVDILNKISIKYSFGLLNKDDEIIGIMIYSTPNITSHIKKYSTNDTDSVIELSRLVCNNNTIKNTESYFIGETLRWLQNNTDYKIVISYVLSEYYNGTIYQATNFEKDMSVSIGGNPVDVYVYHLDKKIRRKYA